MNSDRDFSQLLLLLIAVVIGGWFYHNQTLTSVNNQCSTVEAEYKAYKEAVRDATR